MAPMATPTMSPSSRLAEYLLRFDEPDLVESFFVEDSFLRSLMMESTGYDNHYFIIHHSGRFRDLTEKD